MSTAEQTSPGDTRVNAPVNRWGRAVDSRRVIHGARLTNTVPVGSWGQRVFGDHGADQARRDVIPNPQHLLALTTLIQISDTEGPNP